MAAGALYSAYGNYELKAKYQRNFGLGTLFLIGLVLLILVVAWIVSNLGEVEAVNIAPVVVKTVADLGPPPSVAKKPPQIAVEAPRTVAPKVGIPKPVADDEVIDEDVVLATREELADIVTPDISSASDAGEIVVDIADFGRRHLVIRIIAALRRQIERDQNLLGADLDQLAETAVADLGIAETGIGGHDERIGAVHSRTVAARKGIFARKTHIAKIVEIDLLQMRRRVERLDGNSRVGDEFLAVLPAGRGWRERFLLPPRIFRSQV